MHPKMSPTDSSQTPPPPTSSSMPQLDATTPSEQHSVDDAHNHNTHRISSLNFDRVVNEYSMQATRDSFKSRNEGKQDEQQQYTQQWFQYTKPGTTRWFLSILVGLISGTLAIGIVASSKRIVKWRMNQMEALSEDKQYSMNLIFVWFALVNLGLATIATLLCIFGAPHGIGSGIPEIMAYLNGVRVHFDSSTDDHFASIPLLLVKMIGTVLAVPSFLASDTYWGYCRSRMYQVVYHPIDTE